MIQAKEIAEVLGLKKRAVRSLADLNRAVVEGLRKTCLLACVQSVVATRAEQRELMRKIVPEATYKRRRRHLRPAESERTERLARAFATAKYVWGNQAAARDFFVTPHPELDGQRPLDMARTELGARRIEELLWKIYYGLPV